MKRDDNVSGSERRYLYAGWNLVAEYAWNSSTSTLSLNRSFTWGLDLAGSLDATGGVGALLQIRDEVQNKTLLPTYDGNGNVASLLDADTGAAEAAYEYTPFGETQRATGAYAKDNPFRFSTKWHDEETGLVYYGLRYYNPSLGRFINRDPIEEKGGLHLYAFVANNPVNAFDVLGMNTATVGNRGGGVSRDIGGGITLGDSGIGYAYYVPNEKGDPDPDPYAPDDEPESELDPEPTTGLDISIQIHQNTIVQSGAPNNADREKRREDCRTAARTWFDTTMQQTSANFRIILDSMSGSFLARIDEQFYATGEEVATSVTIGSAATVVGLAAGAVTVGFIGAHTVLAPGEVALINTGFSFGGTIAVSSAVEPNISERDAALGLGGTAMDEAFGAKSGAYSMLVSTVISFTRTGYFENSDSLRFQGNLEALAKRWDFAMDTILEQFRNKLVECDNL